MSPKAKGPTAPSTPSAWTACPLCNRQVPAVGDAPTWHNKSCRRRRQLAREQSK